MNIKTKLFSLLFVLGIGGAVAQPLCIPTAQEVKQTEGTIEVSSITNVTYNDASLQFVAEYLGKAWNAPASLQKKGTSSSIFLSIKADKKLEGEGYRLTISPKGITVQATTPKGALWGAQTLLQMKDTHFAKNNAGVITKGTLPCLTITDKPDYAIRGFMIDVARKFYPLSYLYSLVNVMSYYKMNTLQLHLNDNGFNDQFEGSWDDTYAAFRMESDLFPGLTAIDGSYSKQEMRDLIRYAETVLRWQPRSTTTRISTSRTLNSFLSSTAFMLSILVDQTLSSAAPASISERTSTATRTLPSASASVNSLCTSAMRSRSTASNLSSGEA